MLYSRSPLASHSICISVHMLIPNPQSTTPHLSPWVTKTLFQSLKRFFKGISLQEKSYGYFGSADIFSFLPSWLCSDTGGGTNSGHPVSAGFFPKDWTGMEWVKLCKQWLFQPLKGVSSFCSSSSVGITFLAQ